MLLQEQVKKYARRYVLDVGTGSGIQALTAAKKASVKKVLAVDINPEAVTIVKKEKNKKVTARVSDLFSNVKGKFDTIIFNPPYLPEDEGIEDIRLYGGKKGWETTGRFLEQVGNYLTDKGQVLLLFSSLTDKFKVDSLIDENVFEKELLSKKHVSFEDLYVYRLTRPKVLNNLKEKNLKNIKFFSKGKRGMIYTAEKGKSKKKVAIKVERSDSKAIGRMKIEADFLKVLNKKGIGPKFISSGKGYLIYEFVEGVLIKDWLENSPRAKTRQVLLDVLDQCFVMDNMGINKEEMHHPTKHIVVGKKNVMLDFERCKYSEKPHNVTQFLQYLSSLAPQLKDKGLQVHPEELRSLAKKYRADRKLPQVF